MKFQAHRGIETEFPENTMPAFEAAAIQGYDYIELDPVFTKDDKCVILHDKTLNRTCRNKDGTKLKHEVSISEIHYEEALKYDAGTAKAYKFRGTVIPLLSEVLEFAKKNDIAVKLDNRIQRFSETQTDILFDLVKRSGAHVGFTSSNTEYIKQIISNFPNAEIHYDGDTDESKLSDLRNILKNNELYIWVPILSENTSWVKVPQPDPQLCETVKKYGKLGLWIISDAEELNTAKKYGADIIETPGQIKPKGINRGIYDCHTHSYFSHDSECLPQDSLNEAKKNKLSGCAITDHCDIEYCDTQNLKTLIKNSVIYAKQTVADILAGVEIGESIWNRKEANNIIADNDLDIVLGSVHAARYKNYTMPYSLIDFSVFSQDEIAEYLNVYFENMVEMVEKTDFDVLSHLTCPLRYIVGKYGKKVNLNIYKEKIDEILKLIINKGIALELNTSCLDTKYNDLMPNLTVIKRYRELGGYLVTLGSDAHTSSRIGYGFDFALREISKLGFKNIYFYKKRIPIPSEIKI